MRKTLCAAAVAFLVVPLGCGGEPDDAAGTATSAVESKKIADSSTAVPEVSVSASTTKQSTPKPADPQAVFDKLVEAHRNHDPQAWEQASEELFGMGKSALPVYRRALDSADSDERELAIMLLVQLGPEAISVRDKLLAMLGDESVNIRINAASALSQFPDTSGPLIPVLSELVQNDDTNVRRIALFALGNLQSAEAVPLLIERLDDESAEMQILIAETLARIGPAAAAAVPKLEALGKSKDAGLQAAAAQSIEQIKFEESATTE